MTKSPTKVLTLFFILSGLAVCCSGGDSDFDTSGLPKLNFYHAPSSAEDVSFLSSLAIKTLEAVEKDSLTGDLSALSYDTRDADDESWGEISLFRARNYADAIRMLRKYDIHAHLTISASMVDGYLKYYNDLLYAAAEHALSQEIPGFTGQTRPSLAGNVLGGLQEASLSGMENITTALRDTASIFDMNDEELKTFWQRNPFQYKPLSFYGGDAELEKIFVSDRVLLAQLELDAEVPNSFNAWFSSWGDEESKGAFLAFRDFFSKLTNRPDPALFNNEPLSRLVNERRKKYSCGSAECAYLWPASSPGLLERLPGDDRNAYDDRAEAQPDMETLIEYVKNGDISLEPNEDEGFFIYQRHALESLLTFDRLPESAVVTPSEEILEIWEEGFKAGTAKALETHQKAVDSGSAVAAPPLLSSEVLLLEPVPSLYLRYAKQYKFLRSFVSSLPKSFVDKWMVEGVTALELAEKLEKEMLGLYLISLRQLRMEPAEEGQAHLSEFNGVNLLGEGAEMLRSLDGHPAMAYDQRVIAVQGQPGGPKEKNCEGKPATFWATLGIEAVPVKVQGAGPRFEESIILLDHFAEMKVCVGEPLTREEWRNVLAESSNTRELFGKIKESF